MADSDSRRRSKAVLGPANPVIPDKLYFRIGEVAKILGIAAYVLRFWESEFTQLHPTKGGTGQRLYRRRDVEMALRIKHLLYNEGYTISGARQFLKTEVRERQPVLPLPAPPSPVTPAHVPPDPKKLLNVHSELREIADLLARPLPGTRGVGRTERAAAHKGLHLTPRKSTRSGDKAPMLPLKADDVS